jgi:hypothetical protein
MRKHSAQIGSRDHLHGDSGPGNVEWETTARPQATNAANPRGRGTEKCTDQNFVSERQQAHTRKRGPAAATPPQARGMEPTNETACESEWQVTWQNLLVNESKGEECRRS